jgi:hypothetical protein
VKTRERGYPTPGVFLQEWQTKDLSLTQLVRVANTGLKVVVFSIRCGVFVRVAGKGLREEPLRVENSKLKGEAGELNAETLSARIGEKRKADPSLRSG